MAFSGRGRICDRVQLVNANSHERAIGEGGKIKPISALPPKADMDQRGRDVRFVPCVDGSELARRIFTLQARSVQPCVRPLSAVHITAGHNALRGSGPGQ